MKRKTKTPRQFERMVSTAHSYCVASERATAELDGETYALANPEQLAAGSPPAEITYTLKRAIGAARKHYYQLMALEREWLRMQRAKHSRKK